jgi:AcrR family transcriptional regulator
VPKTTSERRTVTRLDPAVRRTQIIEAAAHLFATRDPAEVPFEEIADAAGVSRALVYNYFGDRGGLLAAVYLHHFEKVNERLRAAASTTSNPADAMRAIVGAYLDFAAEHPGAWRLLRVARAVDHPRVQEVRRTRMREIADGWGGSPEALIVAYGITGLLEEATIEWLQSARTEPERVASVLHDLMWRGLASLDDHGLTVSRP